MIAGRAEIFWLVFAVHLTWTLVSHLPLILVLVFAPSVDHERIVVRVQTLWARPSPWMVRLITGLVVGFHLLLDAFLFYVTGDLFIPA